MSDDIKERIEEAFDLFLNQQFGLFLVRGEAEVVRRATGPRWVSKVYVAGMDSIEIGLIEADDKGRILDAPTPQSVVRAIAEQSSRSEPEYSEDPFAGLGEELADMFSGEDEELADMGELLHRIEKLVSEGTTESISDALQLYPALLEISDDKAPVLRQMGKLALAIGRLEEGAAYLEASAKECALHGDVRCLEELADVMISLAGEDAYLNSRLRTLVEATRQRTRPVQSFSKLSMLRGLPSGIVQDIEFETELVGFESGDDVTVEGEPADTAFFLKSGILKVYISEGNGQRVVRASYPGEFLGESSVIPGAVRTASLRAVGDVEVWQIPGERLKELMDKYEELNHRISLTRYYHSIDSFLFSHPTLGILDVETRAELVSMLKEIRSVPEGTVLLPAGEVPGELFLVLSGSLVMGQAVFGPDSFVPMSDALHRIASETDIRAAEDSQVAVFDALRLHHLAVKSSPEVVAALERAN